MTRTRRLSISLLVGAGLILAACGSEESDKHGESRSTEKSESSSCIDGDGDGFGEGCNSGSDCDDTRSTAYPGAVEICNGVDDNCDNAVDEHLANCDSCVFNCAPVEEEELCTPSDGNAVDDDHDGKVDETCPCELGETRSCCGVGTMTCVGTGGEESISAWGMCEGFDAAQEVCGDGIDQDCDGVDEPCPCIDNDGDGYGENCSAGDDCDDTDGAIHPGATEECNGIDDNCDGQVDEGVLNACGNCDPGCTANFEICTAPGDIARDENQDGRVDEGCACELGTTQGCCGSGIQVCFEPGANGGSVWSQCEGGAMQQEICGDGIDQDCDGLDEDCPLVEVLCENTPHLTQLFSLNFPGNQANCPWGQGDNSHYISGVSAAHIEHSRSMNLPPNAAICSLEFSVPQTNMYYDDNFMISFNEAVLIASFGVNQVLPNEGGLFIYDWSHVHLQTFDYQIYCLGGGACNLPGTESQGAFALNLSQPIMYALGQRALNQHRFDFLAYADGDNNPDRDCTYSPFTLNVNVEYVLP